VDESNKQIQSHICGEITNNVQNNESLHGHFTVMEGTVLRRLKERMPR